jgi:hypothetical protein
MVLLYTINNIFWLKRNLLVIPPPWDQAFYLYMSVRYLHALSDGGPLALFREFVHLNPQIAPLFPLTTVPLYLLFGMSRLVAHMTNAVYFSLLCLGVYLIGKRLYGRQTGLLAVLFMATFTAVVNFSRDYLLEFPAAALVTLGIYTLLRSEDLRHRPWCIGFGALVGLTLLTKTMAGVFFIGPSFYALGRSIRQRRFGVSVLANFLFSIGIAGVVASVWWGPNWRTALGYLIYYGFSAGSTPYRGGGSKIFALQNLGYYSLALINYGTSFFYALLFALLALSKGIKRILRCRGKAAGEVQRERQEGYLWVWLVAGYGILTMVPTKGDERFAQPLLAAIALLLAGSMLAISRQWLRRSLVAAAALIGVVNYVGLTYETPLLPQPRYVPPFAIISYEYPHYRWVRSTIHPASDYHWPIPDLLSALADLHAKRKEPSLEEWRMAARDRAQGLAVDEEVRMIYHLLLKREPNAKAFQKYVAARRRGTMTSEAFIEEILTSREFRSRSLRVLVVPDHPLLNASTLRYYAEVERLPVIFSHIVEGPVEQRRLQEYDCALIKSGGYQGPEFATRYTDQTLAELLRPDSGFVALPRTFLFPDDSHITILAAVDTLR